MDEKLLFAVHEGTVSGHVAGIVMAGHCLPICCSHTLSWSGAKDWPTSEDGFDALWSSTCDVEEFFAAIGIGTGIEDPAGKGNGLWVYEVSYDKDRVDDPDGDTDEWPWLCGGELRRPTVNELAAFCCGEAPWGGRVF